MSTPAELSAKLRAVTEHECEFHSVHVVRAAGEAADQIDSLQAQVEVLRGALKKIRDMEPSAIGDSGFVHGPALLLENCKREARAALNQAQSADSGEGEKT